LIKAANIEKEKVFSFWIEKLKAPFCKRDILNLHTNFKVFLNYITSMRFLSFALIKGTPFATVTFDARFNAVDLVIDANCHPWGELATINHVFPLVCIITWAICERS